MTDSVLLAHDRARGVRLIARVDEVGAGGCWAGPITAAGVLFDLERLASGAAGISSRRERLEATSACQARAARERRLLLVSPWLSGLVGRLRDHEKANRDAVEARSRGTGGG